ncbi:MAG: LCP family protein [Anaerolineae bacterium]|nr:LCP family protein [Anaerolineae bacterium]
MRSITRHLGQATILVILLLLATVIARQLVLSVPSGVNPEVGLAPTATMPNPPAATPPPTITAPPTQTATPTQTGTPTATYTPSPTPPPPNPTHIPPEIDPDVTITGTPHPLPMPTQMPLVEQPGNVVNIVLLGADQNAGGSRGRTDVMVIVSVNPDVPSVNLLSIPRDYYVWIPEHGFNRINTVDSYGHDYPGGGPALVKDTIEYNLGVPIHYYARVNFEGFVHIVDALGGIDIPVECELHDTFPHPDDPEQGVDIDLYPGVQHLDGLHALWYVRSRAGLCVNDSEGDDRDEYGYVLCVDYDRNRRQQQVLRALYKRAMATEVIPRIPELWAAFQGTIETDLGLDDMIWLGWVGSRLDMTNVKSRFIAPPYITSWTAPNGAAVQLPVPGAIDSVIAEAMLPPAAGRADQPPFRVEIWDGTGQPGLATVAAERLVWEGLVVTSINVASEPYVRTQIIDMTTSSKGSPLWLLTRLYHRSAGDVISQPTEGSPFEFRVLLGVDYNPCVTTRSIQYIPPPTPTPTPTTTPEG